MTFSWRRTLRASFHLAVPALLLASLGCAAPKRVAPTFTPTDPEPVWETTQAEALELLQATVRIPSVNPPGGEMQVATLLAERIRREGIDAVVEESAPGRGNVMARLKGDGSKRPLVLLCHIDVVPVEKASWSVDPFAAEVKDGVIYGRGVIDDKGMCVANLLAFLELHRRKIPLARDVVFLATADEEEHGSGVEFMLKKHPDALAAELVLNEGGVGLVGAVFPGEILFAVSAAEKGYTRMRLTATGAAAHGSIPRPGQAPDKLIDALEHLRKKEQALVFHEYVRELVLRVGETRGGMTGFLMRHPDLATGTLMGALAKSPTTRASVSNTVNLTLLRAGDKINVVPGIAEAWIDSRILPGVEPEAWRAEIERELAPFGVKVTLEGGQKASTSTWDTDLFRALERHLPEGLENAVVAPILSPGYTDAKPFRERGATAYGIIPFVVTQEEFAGMHGHDERLKVSELGAGVRRIYRVLVDTAGKGATQ